LICACGGVGRGSEGGYVLVLILVEAKVGNGVGLELWFLWLGLMSLIHYSPLSNAAEK
jgi:hypothetical protein